MIGLQNYMVLDAARMQGFIFKARELNEHHHCLFQGDSEMVLGHVAPWLFLLDQNEDSFNEWLSENGEDDNWGVIMQADISDKEIIKHLRKFLMVLQEDGTELLFRFYDPRVLRVFLPACNADELVEFFGPIMAFIMEDDDGNMLRFELDGGALKQIDLDMDLDSFLSTPISQITMEDPSITKQIPDTNKSKDRWDF
jgi:hypothetical protein